MLDPVCGSGRFRDSVFVWFNEFKVGTPIAFALNSRVNRGVHDSSNLTFQILEIAMLGWALTFLVIALIAGVLGFGVVAGTAATIAKILFVVFLVLFVIGLIMGRRGPVA